MWLFRETSSIRRDMVYTSELNAIVAQLNVLAASVHKAHVRTSGELLRARSDIGSLEANGAELRQAFEHNQDSADRAAAAAAVAAKREALNEAERRFVTSEQFERAVAARA
jgi:hypothetical protein